MSLGYPDLQWSLNKISQCQLLIFKTNLNAKMSVNLFRFRQYLQTNLNIEQDEKNNEQSSDFSKKILYVGNLSPIVTGEDLNKFFGFKTTSYLQKTCKVELSVCPKTGNSRCFAYVTVPYHVYKEIIKLNGVVFKSKPLKTEQAKVKPKARSQRYKISGNSYNPLMQKQQTSHQQHQPQFQQTASGNSYNPLMQKQQTSHQQHQSQYQQPAAQHLPILKPTNQQNSVLKSQYAMHQR